MFNPRRITGGGPKNDKGGGRFLCAAVLLAFILTTGLFLSACGGGGSTGTPTPGPGNGNEGPAVTVSFGSFSYSTAEGGMAVTVEVTLSADPERSVVIPLAVGETGTATTADYSGLPQSVTFASGETAKSITLAITDDAVDEGSETLILGFGTLPEGVTAGATSMTTVTIADNDAPSSQTPAVTVSFGAPAYSVAEGGTVTVEVTLSADPERSVTIPFTITGTAQRGGDYSGVPANIKFASGETTKDITVTVHEDIEDDDDETLVLAFGTLPQGVTPQAPSLTTVTITDNDDPRVTVSFDAASLEVDEGLVLTVAVTLSADPERSVEVPVTVDGRSTATRTKDYTGAPANVTFTSGETTKDIPLITTDDTVNEDDETVILNFGTLPPRVSNGTHSSVTIKILDDDASIPCNEEGVITVPGDYDATTADPDPDPQREGLFICGNEMNNVIKGGDGPDTIMGRDGNDTLQGRKGDDTLDGGPGEDTVIYSVAGAFGIEVKLWEGQASDSHNGADTLLGIENVECEGENSAAVAVIAGDIRNNRISCEGSRQNILLGREGADTFVYSYGKNYYDGSAGADTLDFSGLTSVPGTLTIALNLIESHREQPFGTSEYGYFGKIGILNDSSNNTYDSFARLTGEDNYTKGSAQTNIENIIGSDFPDDLTGHAGNNRLEGGGENDTLRGVGGADTLIGGAGTDALEGGPGDDTYHADSSDTVTEADDGGTDTLYYEGGAITHDLTYTELLGMNATKELAPDNIETVYGTSGADTLRAAAGGVTVIGGGGDDNLVGGNGANTLIGCAGQDSFYSNTGSTSDGDAPYTEPSGSDCSDSTTCADGVNTFVLVHDNSDSADQPNRIQSFRTGDKIILAGFPVAVGGNTTFTAAAATVSEMPTGWTSETGTSSTWVDFKVDNTRVAFIKEVGFTGTGTAAEELADHLTGDPSPVTVERDYDTGCDAI